MTQNSQLPAPSGRVIRGAAASRMESLYPATRLLKGAVLEAEMLRNEARNANGIAQAEAAKIRQAAQSEVDAARREAFAKGAAEGAADFAQLLIRLQEELDNFRQRFAADVQRVAFRFARAILDVEFEARPERIVQMVSKVMKPARLYHEIKIHLNPNDVERVRAEQEKLASQLPLAKQIQFCADPALPPHGVRVETEMGSYDGTLDTQIRRLQEHLLPGQSPLIDDELVEESAAPSARDAENNAPPAREPS